MAARKHGLLFGLLSFVLVVVLIAGIVILIVAQLTPRQLGMANVKLTETYTVEGLGVADVKVKQAFKLAKSLTTEHSRETIASNGYTTADGTTCDQKFGALGSVVFGDRNYERLLVLPLLSVSKPVLKDRELAYALDTALHQFYASPEGDLASSYVNAVEVLQRLDASVAELTFVQRDGKIILKTVLQLNVSEYVKDINAAIKKISIKDIVFCTFENEIEFAGSTALFDDVEGVIGCKAFAGVVINDQPSDVSQIALDALLKLTCDAENMQTSESIGVAICTLIGDFCRHIGKIGSRSGLTVNYGISGVNFETHEITFL